MYISLICIENYRCFSSCTVELNPNLTILIGENNIGKTNLLSALALIFSPDVSNSSRYLEIEDIFNLWREQASLPIVRICVELAGMNNDEEKALVARWLVNSREELRARITYEFRPLVDQDGPFASDYNLPIDQYEWVIYGGKREQEQIDFRDLSQIRLELLHALRDAQRELSRGGQRRFGRLIARFKPDNYDEDGEPDKRKISRAVRYLNQRLERTSPVRNAQDQLNQRLAKVAGESNKQNAALIASDVAYEDLIKNLQVLISNPGQQPHRVDFNGLGYNNLLFISALLTDFYRRRQLSNQQAITLPIVAIEEPEAHLHPHLQKFLNRYFATNDDGQVVVTSHSTHITSSVNPEHIVVLYRDSSGNIRAAKIKNLFGHNAESRRHLRSLQRHLDATNSTLFFSKSVILVEGLSEAILLPVIARKVYEIDLDDKGISIVSVHGTSFKPFLRFFGNDAIRKKCAVLTDADPPVSPNPSLAYNSEEDFFPLNIDDPEYQPSESSTNLKDAQSSNDFVEVFINLKTLEHDLIVSMDRAIIENALDLAVSMSVKITQPKVDLAKEKSEMRNFSKAVLDVVKDAKGSFAQALAEVIIDNDEVGRIPDYIKNSFIFLGIIEEE